jgi:hypothetical protein
MQFWRLFLGLIVLGCICISVVFAFEFGFTRGSTWLHGLAFGLIAAFLECFKAWLPIRAGAAKAQGETAIAIMSWVFFGWLVMLSLLCSTGMTAVELANKFASKAVAASDKDTKQGKLDRLLADKKLLPTFTPTDAGAVDDAEKALKAAEADVRAECGEHGERRGKRCLAREADERKARDDLKLIKADFNTTQAAAKLSDQIATADADVRNANTETAVKDVDPQAKSLSDITGIPQAVVAFAMQAFLAIGIEFGSGLGLRLVYGHGHERREEIELQPEPPLLLTAETPEQARDRFIKAYMLHKAGQRALQAETYRRFTAWCAKYGITPVSLHIFKQGVPFEKDRIGGKVYFLDCCMADA